MAHIIRDKKKLLNRVRRIRGQMDAVEKALDQEQDCSTILLTIAACRGAINSLMAEIIEGHIRFHVVDPDQHPASREGQGRSGIDRRGEGVFEVSQKSSRSHTMEDISLRTPRIDLAASATPSATPRTDNSVTAVHRAEAAGQPRNRDHQDDHDHDHDDHDHDHALDWVELVRIGLVAVAVIASWFGLWKSLAGVLGFADAFANFDVIALAATLIGGYPIFKEAIANAVARRMTMELSMTIALASALAIGEFFTALVIVLFVLVAEVLEGLTVGRGRRAIKDLLDLLPRNAIIRREGGTHEVEANELKLGDVVVVRPGSRLPVDGEVLSGNSFVDQSAITGESMPVEKMVGTAVYAGTINQSGVLEIRTTGIGRDTAFGKIIEAVERAEKSKAPIQKIADRLAGYLVYFALACALLTFLVTRNVNATISVIIVAGACGIAAGTPLAILGAIGRSARQGAIIKGGLYLEILGTVDTIVLDKTGTLTLGNPKVSSVQSLPWRHSRSCGGSCGDCRAALRASPCQSDLGEGRGVVLMCHRTGTLRVCTRPRHRLLGGRRASHRRQPGLPRTATASTLRPWPLPPITHPKCWWHAADGCWGRSKSLTCCGPNPFRRSPNCGRWACERSSSPGIRRPLPWRSASSWASTRWRPSSSPTRSWLGSRL